jgi:hypothetical protein
MSAPYSFRSVRANPESAVSSIHVELTMKSDIAALLPVVDELMALIRKSRCVPGGERDVECALREALDNAVVHGNRKDSQKQVHISCQCLNLIEMAGEGSALAKKYKIQLHHVAVTNLPEDYATRLTEMFPRMFKNLRLLSPDPYDFILSKLERNSAKDRDDANYIFKTKKLSSQILRERYERELRPYLSKEKWHDDTLELWTEIFETTN